MQTILFFSFFFLHENLFVWFRCGWVFLFLTKASLWSNAPFHRATLLTLTIFIFESGTIGSAWKSKQRWSSRKLYFQKSLGIIKILLHTRMISNRVLENKKHSDWFRNEIKIFMKFQHFRIKFILHILRGNFTHSLSDKN